MAYTSLRYNVTASATQFSAEIEYLAVSNELQLPEVMASKQWQSAALPSEILSKPTKEQWVKISLASTVPYELDIHVVVNNPSIDLLDFFANDISDHQAGLRFIGDHRQLSKSSDYSIPQFTVSLIPFDKATVYIRAVMSRNSSLPIQVLNNDQLKEFQEFSLILWGAFLGLTLIMILYYISLYRAMGESIYIAYMSFTVVTLLYLSLLYGFGYHFVPFSILTFLAGYLGTIGLVLMRSILMFSRSFIAIEKTKHDDYVTKWLSFSMAVLIVISLVFPQRWVILCSLLLQPILFIYLSSLFFKSFRRKQYWSQFYLASWLPVFFGLPITTMATLGLIDSTFITRHALFLSIISQLALTAGSFAERMKVTEMRRIYQATHDRYTGLPNRSALVQTLNKQMNQPEPFSLVFIEVRNFLRFLPYVGSERASKLVAEVATLVQMHWMQNQNDFSSVHDSKFNPPYLVRDHVLAILVDTEKAHDYMSELYDQCDCDITVAGIEISVNPVLAASSYPENSVQADDLVQKSMQALELAKNEGLPFAMYFESRVQYSEQEVKIATDLRKAIINNDLFLYHQPQIVLEDFSVHGSEVLLRWDHPELGFIPPNIFVKVAEDIGMIEDLTLWVIDCAFSQQHKLIEEGYEHKISINISGKDVNNKRFFQEVSRLLAKYGIDGGLVTLELTESVTVKDRLALKNLMAQFKDIDVQFSIDDFGTGFSSLEALSELNFNELKIDRSFVQDMVDSKRNYTISSATIELANRLELDTVAEGVENEKVVSMLKGCFCKIGQGYYFSKPLPFDDYLNWLKNE
jgi:EAL domain-containing protein (putative c-di-GMP-specific phosphodiesterase class I)